ncbi:MAG: tetratricopeptide repeat protein [Phototrophicaceae bacterium]|jgi:tetratricopeptide (TPR) repeat protein
MREVSSQIRQEIQEIVAGTLPDRQTRLAFRAAAFSSEPNLAYEIVIDGSPREFAIHVVDKAIGYGQMQNRELAIVAVLVGVVQITGEDHIKTRAFAIIRQIDPSKGKVTLEELIGLIIAAVVRTELNRLSAAIYLHKQGKLAEALEQYTLVINNDLLQEPGIYALRAELFMTIGAYQEAAADFTKAIQRRFEGGATIYLERGKAYRHMNSPHAALKDFNEAIRREPKSALAYHCRAMAYRSLKDYRRALEDHNEAITLQPHAVDFYYQRGRTHKRAKQFDLALADYKKALKIQPNHIDVHISRGTLYFEHQRDEEALRDYDIAIAHAPALNDSIFVAHKNRGMIHYYRGYYQRAIDDFDVALRIKPRDDDTRLCRASALRRLHR